jgi:hypothetical protein
MVMYTVQVFRQELEVVYGAADKIPERELRALERWEELAKGPISESERDEIKAILRKVVKPWVDAHPTFRWNVEK